MKSYYLQSDIEEIYNRLQEHRELIDNKTFLIVGGNGFLGKYIQAALSKFNDVKIIAVDKYKPEMELPNVVYCQIDVLEMDAEVVDTYFADVKFDYVLAAASIASPKVYKDKPIETMDVGYIGLKNCLELATADHAKLLFFSSSEVYGSATEIPTPETYVGAIPSDTERSCYDLSKIWGSSLVHYYVQKRNLNASIVLPFNFYGAQIPDGRVMPSFMQKIVNNKPVEIFDGGDHKRTYTYITDGIVGCLLVLLKGENSRKYNIGNPNDMVSVVELANRMEKVIEKEIDEDLISYPSSYAGIGNPTVRMPSIERAKNELGFEPQISLDEGIKRFYSWAQENYIESNNV